MITFNNIVERFEIFAQNHFFIKTFSFGSPDDADLSKFTDFPLMHLVYTGANYDAGTKTYNIEVYILDVPADKTDKVDRQKEVVSDAEQCAEDIIADIKNGGNIFLFAQDYEVVNATTTPLEEETKNVLSGVLLDLSVAIPYEWDACNAPIDGVEPGGTEVTYARRGVLRMLTIDGTTDVQSVRTINVTNGTLTDDGDGVVTLDTGGAETLNDLTDVDTTGVTDGQVLKYDNASGEWLPGNDQSATSLGNLDDVSIVTPANREALIYDGSEWVNDTVAKGDIGLGNVDNTSDADKPVSTATQTALDAKADTSAVPTELNDLSDVTITGTPTGNQALIYDGTANVFKSLPNFTNRFEDEAEINKQAITPFAERVYTVKADGDGIFIDAESDTPTAGKVIKRKIYQKAGFLESGAVIGDFTLIHTFADDTVYSATESTFEGFRDGDTYGTPPFTLIQTWEEETAAPSFTGLLNESYGSGAAAGFGTRRLNGNYSGACMTIRRASDGTTQAIGFVGEEIDESAITTFCTGTTCTVQTWHDQSQTGGTGSGNDATQTTPANQPTIYTGGALVKEGGRLALDFDGANDYLSNAGNFTYTSGLSIYAVSKFDSLSNTERLICDDITGVQGFFIYSSSGYLQINDNDTGFVNRNLLGADLTQQVRSFNFNGSTGAYNYAYNGSNTSASIAGWTGPINSTNTANIGVMGSGNGSQLGDGLVQEIIAYPSDKSTDRTNIEGNISAYYQSAKLLDEQFGSGAEAAYSTRQLRRAQTDCMVIRRASDSTTQTIGFDANGNIDEAAINTFCSGTTCTVYQWLDQSGNGNTATAAAPANEPTIYTGGALVKENGKLALDFDGASDYLSTSNGVANDPELTIFQTCIATGTNTGVQINYALPQIAGAHTDPYGRLILLRRFGDTMITRLNGATTNQGSGSYPLSKTLFTLNSKQGFVDASGTNTGTFTGADITYPNSVPFIIGANGGAGENWEGKNQEIIVYASDKSSADQTSIESNVGDYFTQNTPLLDTYTGAAAAYSLRKLSSSYSGSAIRVRRSSDNTEQDIGFNVFSELDTVSLLAFAGTGDAFVKTWYCQSGNSNDATQTATGSQPQIVSSGAVIVENGKPAVEGNASSYYLQTSGMNVDFTGGYTYYWTGARFGYNRHPFMFYQYSLSGSFAIRYLSGTMAEHQLSNLNISSYNSSDKHIIQSVFYNGATSAELYISDSASQQSSTNVVSTLNSTSNKDLTLLAGWQSGAPRSPQDGNFQELIIWDSDQSANRTNIESNINTFYSIY